MLNKQDFFDALESRAQAASRRRTPFQPDVGAGRPFARTTGALRGAALLLHRPDPAAVRRALRTTAGPRRAPAPAGEPAGRGNAGHAGKTASGPADQFCRGLRSDTGRTSSTRTCATKSFPQRGPWRAWIWELSTIRHLAESAAGIMVALEGQLPTLYPAYGQGDAQDGVQR